jgi:Ca2+-binding RTX toxin-like protein
LLTGGKGRDRLLGGSGSDRLLARDGVRDRVDGGPGRDTARVDARRDQVKSVAVLLR